MSDHVAETTNQIEIPSYACVYPNFAYTAPVVREGFVPGLDQGLVLLNRHVSPSPDSFSDYLRRCALKASEHPITGDAVRTPDQAIQCVMSLLPELRDQATKRKGQLVGMLAEILDDAVINPQNVGKPLVEIHYGVVPEGTVPLEGNGHPVTWEDYHALFLESEGNYGERWLVGLPLSAEGGLAPTQRLEACIADKLLSTPDFSISTEMYNPDEVFGVVSSVAGSLEDRAKVDSLMDQTAEVHSVLALQIFQATGLIPEESTDETEGLIAFVEAYDEQCGLD